MTDLIPRNAQQGLSASRLMSDAELAQLRPAPRRDADLVARRARARGCASSRSSRIWPILITGGAVASYLTAAGVLR